MYDIQRLNFSYSMFHHFQGESWSDVDSDMVKSCAIDKCIKLARATKGTYRVFSVFDGIVFEIKTNQDI